MNWLYIIFLPVAASLLWPFLMVMVKRNPLLSQMILGLTMTIEAFAMIMLFITLHGKTDELFIYDFLLLVSVATCGPLYFTGICALTEPRGASPRQRRVLIIPLLYTAGLTIGAWLMGIRNYEAMCLAIHNGSIAWNGSGTGWQFMYIWHNIVFGFLLVVVNIILMVIANRKLTVFRNRFNSFYADRLGKPLPKHRPVTIFSWIFLPLCLALLLLITHNPRAAKYLTVFLSVVIAAIQFFYGRYIYNLNYDARYLNKLLNEK